MRYPAQGFRTVRRPACASVCCVRAARQSIRTGRAQRKKQFPWQTFEALPQHVDKGEVDGVDAQCQSPQPAENSQPEKRVVGEGDYRGAHPREIGAHDVILKGCCAVAADKKMDLCELERVARRKQHHSLRLLSDSCFTSN